MRIGIERFHSQNFHTSRNSFLNAFFARFQYKIIKNKTKQYPSPNQKFTHNLICDVVNKTIMTQRSEEMSNLQMFCTIMSSIF